MNATATQIRWAIRRDIPEILAIEAASFDVPWNEDEFISTLRERNCVGMVAECGEAIVGFMLYELRRRDLHLLNFAVLPRARRQGVGTEMVARLIRKLNVQRNAITLEVRESNLPAQQFWRACGFKATGVLREHYVDTDEDAYSFRLEVQG